jgi:hypothetical protein
VSRSIGRSLPWCTEHDMVNVKGGTSQISILTFKILGPFWWIWGLKSVLIVMFANDQNEMMVFYLQPLQLLLDYTAGLYENSQTKSPHRLHDYNNWRRGQRSVCREPPKVRASYSKSWVCLRRQKLASDPELLAWKFRSYFARFNLFL